MAESPVNLSPAMLRLSMGCNLAEVRGVAAQTGAFFARHGVSASEILDCELALVEACNNAVRYAGPEGKGKDIEIEIGCDFEQIEMRVRDHTLGFSWPEKASLPETSDESGRGIYLMQTLMNSTEYHRAKEGNLLVLRKRRTLTT